MNKKKHLVYLGLSGFPIGFAPIKRQKLIALGFIESGWRVTIICNKAVHSNSTNISKKGSFLGIDYLYVTGSIRSKNYLIRNILKILAPLLEFLNLIHLKIKYNIDLVIVTDRNLIWDALKYFIYSRLLGFKLLLNYVESYENRKNTNSLSNINDIFFNKYGLYFYDIILPISNYLNNRAVAKNKISFIIPILVDIEAIDCVSPSDNSSKSIVYCGSADYFESIAFLLNAFNRLNDSESMLIIVANGSKSQISKITDLIKLSKKPNKIQIRSGLTDEGLYSLYKSATCLALPLFDTIQDKARFPHKLAEYLASGRPVIANPIGDIQQYLQDKVNVIYSEFGNIDSFAQNIDLVLSDSVWANKIGSAGRSICEEYFNYKSINGPLLEFIERYTRK